MWAAMTQHRAAQRVGSVRAWLVEVVLRVLVQPCKGEVRRLCGEGEGVGGTQVQGSLCLMQVGGDRKPPLSGFCLRQRWAGALGRHTSREGVRTLGRRPPGSAAWSVVLVLSALRTR